MTWDTRSRSSRTTVTQYHFPDEVNGHSPAESDRSPQPNYNPRHQEPPNTSDTRIPHDRSSTWEAFDPHDNSHHIYHRYGETKTNAGASSQESCSPPIPLDGKASRETLGRRGAEYAEHILTYGTRGDHREPCDWNCDPRSRATHHERGFPSEVYQEYDTGRRDFTSRPRHGAHPYGTPGQTGFTTTSRFKETRTEGLGEPGRIPPNHPLPRSPPEAQSLKHEEYHPSFGGTQITRSQGRGKNNIPNYVLRQLPGPGYEFSYSERTSETITYIFEKNTGRDGFSRGFAISTWI